MPTKKIATKCQTNPFIWSLLDSAAIHIVQAVAVRIKSQLKPAITQVAKGAAKNSAHAESPRYTKWFVKQTTGIENPKTERAA